MLGHSTMVVSSDMVKWSMLGKTVYRLCYTGEQLTLQGSQVGGHTTHHHDTVAQEHQEPA